MIDPQFPMRDRQGNEIWHSVTAYLEAYEEHAAALRANPKDPIPMLMLDSFDPEGRPQVPGHRIARQDLRRRPAQSVKDCPLRPFRLSF